MNRTEKLRRFEKALAIFIERVRKDPGLLAAVLVGSLTEETIWRKDAITGASGSGKSSLVHDIVYKKLASLRYDSRILAGAHDALEGHEAVDDVIDIDQSPIGRSPRSNPATYVGIYDAVRELFAETKESLPSWGKSAAAVITCISWMSRRLACTSPISNACSIVSTASSTLAIRFW